MKSQKFFLLIIFLLLNFDLYCDESNKTFINGKSFFSVQPIAKPADPMMVSIRRDQLNIYQSERSVIDAIVYGGQSADEDKLARYFLPFNKSKVLVGELGSQAVKQQNVDIIANYFGVLTYNQFKPGDPVNSTLNNYTFQSELSFHPKQTYAGVVLSYKQHVSRYTDKGFWFEIVVPLEYVKNDIGLKERVITPGGPNGDNPQVPNGFFPNMKAAFRQKDWRFGKIDGPQSKFGVADLYIRAGYVYMKEETHHLNSYLGFSAPSGTTPNGEFLFEPIVGSNGHATIFTGISGGFKIWSRCDKSLSFEFDTLGTLFIENEQTRSLDLKDKSWSRYMWVYLDKKSTFTHAGINVFTKRVKVNPSTARDLTTAFVYKTLSGFQAELGYHFYARQAEEIKLANDWRKKPAIAAIIKDDEFILGGTSRDNATINEYLRIGNDSIDNNDVYRPLKESDLDLDSAAHPGVLSHTGYLALSYNWDCDKNPKFVGAGGSYEFSTNNAALTKWMLWGRIGIYF